MIKLITTGKIEKNYQNLLDEYIKKINIYEKIVHTQLKEEKLKSDGSNITQKLEAETKRALQNADGDIYFLDERGEFYDSIEFSEIIKKNHEKGRATSFIIGGSNGYDQELIKNHKKISLSKMTFLHHFATLFLIEQIYRAFTIINKKEYHK